MTGNLNKLASDLDDISRADRREVCLVHDSGAAREKGKEVRDSVSEYINQERRLVMAMCREHQSSFG